MSVCRVHSSGVAIERYWWMRANVSGCENVSLPTGFDGSAGGSNTVLALQGLEPSYCWLKRWSTSVTMNRG